MLVRRSHRTRPSGLRRAAVVPLSSAERSRPPRSARSRAGTATLGDAFVGTKRLQIVKERAACANIRLASGGCRS
jgi:hypothetical protein